MAQTMPSSPACTRFAYADAAAWHDLAKRLNKAGAALAEQGVRLLYHNHNCELQRVEGEKRGYDILLAETEPQRRQL